MARGGRMKSKGMAIVITSHISHDTNKLCDEFFRLSNTRLEEFFFKEKNNLNT